MSTFLPIALRRKTSFFFIFSPVFWLTSFLILSSPSAEAQFTWTSQNSAVDNFWYGVTYGKGLFVAVGLNGTGNRVMTSPDGVTWTSRTSAADNQWRSITYGGGIFVALASTGTGNRIMTSPDGINWTSRTSSSDFQSTSITYGDGMFVAVGQSSVLMTSPDGITWTTRTASAAKGWNSVAYGGGLFVAVASYSTTSAVMTSPDGINWTSRTSADNNWQSVTYGGGLFVATAFSGTGNRVMTSPDGINWTIRVSAADNQWYGITYGGGVFVAVANSGTGNRVMTSPDGIVWTSRASASDNNWYTVTYGNGLFVSVSGTGTGNRVMTSGTLGSSLPLKLLTFTSAANTENVALSWETAYEVNTAGFDIEAAIDAVHFSKAGHVVALNNNLTEKSVYHYNAAFIKTAAVSYYRLKMLDQDGSFSYSKIVSVRNPDKINGYQVFPNPVQNEQLTVKSNTTQTGPVDLSVFDTAGKLLYNTKVDSKDLNQQQVQIPMKGLNPSSNYILKITETTTGTSQRFQFFKK